MHHFQQEIGELERELAVANDEQRKNQSTLSKLKYNKQDATAQERARSAFEVRIQKIRANIKTIEDKQRNMMRNDPRQIRQGNLTILPPKP
jgi:septal ring factor EnvC (AmiA/AmiB activator)